MENIAYFVLLSIELSINLVNCDDEGYEVGPIFSENNAKAVFHAQVPHCLPTDLILKDDDKLFDVTKLELKNHCQSQSWKLTSENIFKRYSKLTDLSIQGTIKTLKNVEAELFNVPTILCFHLRDCLPHAATNQRWVMPPNLAKLIIEQCEHQYINFNKTAKLKYLKIINHSIRTLPDFAFPSVRDMDIRYAEQIHVKVQDVAFFCNMTKFLFNVEHMKLQDVCECELLKKWQEYLETQNITLTIETENRSLKKETCAQPGSCPQLDGPLKEANNSRIRCLSLKPPEVPVVLTTQKKEFDSSKWLFWIFIVGGFLIISFIFALVMFAAEKLFKTSPETPQDWFTNEEAEEEEEEEVEQEGEEE